MKISKELRLEAGTKLYNRWMAHVTRYAREPNCEEVTIMCMQVIEELNDEQKASASEEGREKS